MPKTAGFKYEFEKGKPWLHNDLIAPFDFAVYKSQEEINQELSDVKLNKKHFVANNVELINRKRKELSFKFDETWATSNFSPTSSKGLRKLFSKALSSSEKPSTKDDFKSFILSIYDNVYEKGVIEINETLNKQDKSSPITVITNNVASEKQLNSFFTIKTAYKFVEDQLLVLSEKERSFLTPLIENVLIQNLTYDKSLTEKVLEEELNSVSYTVGAIQKDQKVISQGEVVTHDLYLQLQSLKTDYTQRVGKSGTTSNFYISIGQLILVASIIALLLGFVYIFRQDIYSDNEKVAFILIIITAMVSLASLGTKYDSLNIYIIPFCLIPLLIRTFFDMRMAIFIHLITILLASFFAPNGSEFIFIQLVAGVASVYYIVRIVKRSQLFVVSLIIFGIYSLTFMGFSLIKEADFSNVKYAQLGWFAISAFFTLFAYPLMYLFEKVFHFLSDVTLLELSDTNSPLLRELAEKAPGTFQHSLQVANLAEAAVRAIDGNPLLIRTGALYHDIGKLKNPAFFIENQSGVNPHDKLQPETSSKIIVNHVIHGIELAKKHNLPDELIDFIRTHHGTSTTGYFYAIYKKNNPEGELSKEAFSYPGPTPFSLETAVLMMADAVEAASRSLTHHTEENLKELIEKLIEGQSAEKQFVNADITFKDISEIKKVFLQKLLNIYHVRIEYPK